jgi:hypothetical protein
VKLKSKKLTKRQRDQRWIDWMVRRVKAPRKDVIIDGLIGVACGAPPLIDAEGKRHDIGNH